ncbi:unnamed protein product [Boreogadus saida]
MRSAQCCEAFICGGVPRMFPSSQFGSPLGTESVEMKESEGSPSTQTHVQAGNTPLLGVPFAPPNRAVCSELVAGASRGRIVMRRFS